eukprot:1159870-Pelagomonas_calceolata.AAC.7
MQYINEHHENPVYLPGASLGENLIANNDLIETCWQSVGSIKTSTSFLACKVALVGHTGQHVLIRSKYILFWGCQLIGVLHPASIAAREPGRMIRTGSAAAGSNAHVLFCFEGV